MYTDVYTCTYIYIYTYIHIFIYTFIYIHTYHVHIYICIYICMYIYTYKWASVPPIRSRKGWQLVVQVWIHCTPSQSLLFVHSFYTLVKMTQYLFIKSHLVAQNPPGICNFEELCVFAHDSIRIIWHLTFKMWLILVKSQSSRRDHPSPHTHISLKSILDQCQQHVFAEIVWNVADCFVYTYVDMYSYM